MAKTPTESRFSLRRTSWWVVVISGTLLVVFLVAIVREIINGHQVRTQVDRLRQQVASAEQHQQQLKDLIDYLQSPTFQEREARLQLGLKKSGESVMVVPTTNGNVSTNTSSPAASSSPEDVSDQSHAARWWTYFFGPQPS